MFWRSEKKGKVSDNVARYSKTPGEGTYPEALGISAGHGVYGLAGLVDENGGHDVNAADEF